MQRSDNNQDSKQDATEDATANPEKEDNQSDSEVSEPAAITIGEYCDIVEKEEQV